MMRHFSQLELEPFLGAFAPVKNWILEDCPDSPKKKKAILACEKAFVNIVNYSGAGRIKVSCACTERILKVTLRDDGIRFDPFEEQEKPEKDFEYFDGGMGINMIREFLEHASWNYEENENVLKLEFCL